MQILCNLNSFMVVRLNCNALGNILTAIGSSSKCLSRLQCCEFDKCRHDACVDELMNGKIIGLGSILLS